MTAPRVHKTVKLLLDQMVPKVPSGKLLGWQLADDYGSLELFIEAYRKPLIRRVDKKPPKR